MTSGFFLICIITYKAIPACIPYKTAERRPNATIKSHIGLLGPFVTPLRPFGHSTSRKDCGADTLVVQVTSQSSELRRKHIAMTPEKVSARPGGFRRVSRCRCRDVGALKKAMPGIRRVWNTTPLPWLSRYTGRRERGALCTLIRPLLTIAKLRQWRPEPCSR